MCACGWEGAWSWNISTIPRLQSSIQCRQGLGRYSQRLRSLRPSHLIFPKDKQEINRVIISLPSVQGREERSNHHQDRGTTLKNLKNRVVMIFFFIHGREGEATTRATELPWEILNTCTKTLSNGSLGGESVLSTQSLVCSQLLCFHTWGLIQTPNLTCHFFFFFQDLVVGYRWHTLKASWGSFFVHLYRIT